MADYKIWLPFQLSPGSEIIGLEDAAPGEVLGYPAQLQGNRPHYVLMVRGLGSEVEANALLDRVGAGLLWAATEHPMGMGIKFSLEQQTVVYARDPREAAENIRRTIHPDAVLGLVDAIIDGGRTAIFPDHKAVYQVLGGELSGCPKRARPESIFSHISKGAALPNAVIFATDRKLRLGFEVYCLSHFDSTEPARFLTLCTALEVLALRLVPPNISKSL